MMPYIREARAAEQWVAMALCKLYNKTISEAKITTHVLGAKSGAANAILA